MIKYSLFFIFFCNLLFAEECPTVLVSVAPHKFFVERIAGDSVKVKLIVPQGVSSHTYEPSMRQMIGVSSAKIWFFIGESFELKALAAFKSYGSPMEFVDLKQNLPLIQDSALNHTCCSASCDLHFWLSPRLAKIQAKTISEALSAKFPSFASLYQKNCLDFQNELDRLDEQLKNILKECKNKMIVVSHPAYAYFCKDYDLKQHSIEVEGRDPSSKQVSQLIAETKEAGVRVIFVQKQYNHKAAKLIAEGIGARLITLDPYSEAYFASMNEIAHAFASP